jgi:hypothetical protein
MFFSSAPMRNARAFSSPRVFVAFPEKKLFNVPNCVPVWAGFMFGFRAIMSSYNTDQCIVLGVKITDLIWHSNYLGSG